MADKIESSKLVTGKINNTETKTDTKSPGDKNILKLGNKLNSLLSSVAHHQKLLEEKRGYGIRKKHHVKFQYLLYLKHKNIKIKSQMRTLL